MLLVGGVNYVLRGRTPEQVLADILNLKKSFQSRNQDPASGHLSSFEVATVTFPPLMTVMPENRDTSMTKMFLNVLK